MDFGSSSCINITFECFKNNMLTAGHTGPKYIIVCFLQIGITSCRTTLWWFSAHSPSHCFFRFNCMCRSTHDPGRTCAKWGKNLKVPFNLRFGSSKELWKFDLSDYIEFDSWLFSLLPFLKLSSAILKTCQRKAPTPIMASVYLVFLVKSRHYILINIQHSQLSRKNHDCLHLKCR